MKYNPTEYAITLKERALSTLAPTMPDGFHYGAHNRSFLGVEYISIWMRPSDTTVNNVAGQYPAVVSLSLEVASLTLKTQIYGGCGGQTFAVHPPKNSHYASESVKVPFRRPKTTETAVFKAIERFAERYVDLLKKHAHNLQDTEHFTLEARQYLGIQETS